MSRLWPNRRGLIAAAIVALLLLAVLIAMDRPPICTCGNVKLWHGVVESAENSQHLSDWYTPSHITHGLIFYLLGWLLWRRWPGLGGGPALWALALAVAIEGGWEILENTSFIIDRYREVTISWGYSGDSIINSMADIGWMSLGFVLAARMPAWGSVVLALGFEVFTLVMIRDNLTLNVLMLVWPIDAIKVWQGMG